MTIKKGDKVKISGVQGNFWAIGTVISAENNNFGKQFQESGKDSNWYIELKVEKGNIPDGYTYWKQLQDGGTVEKVLVLGNSMMEIPLNEEDRDD